MRLDDTSRRSAAGFTLLETLVALAITAVLLGALATTVPTALRARAIATARLERATTSRTFLLHLEHELASALAGPFLVAGAPLPRLQFVGGAEPGEQLAYTLEAGVLVRRAAARWAVPDPSRPSMPVLDQLAGLELRAFDGARWVDTWQADVPPPAVRIRLLFADGDAVGTVATIPTARPRSAS